MRQRLSTIFTGLVVIAIVAVVAIVEFGGSSNQRTIYASFQSATNLVSGAKVTAGGQTVGEVGPIQLRNGVAVVRLDISDAKVWPLHQGTQAEIRWGGTLSYSNRYVELMPGPTSNPALPDDARLATQNTITPVEFDQFFDIFNGPTRASLGGLITNGASTFDSEAGALHNGLDATAPALRSISGVLQQLGEDPAALETLIGAGANTAGALHAEQPQLQNLVASAANTFATIGDNASATQATLSQLSPALQSADTALDRLDSPTLGELNTLVNQIRPGAVALKELAAPLNGALTKLHTVAPQLNSTLDVVGNSAPRITTLLDTAKPTLTAARSSLASFEPMAACLLPYGPEIGGFIETWQSFLSGYDPSSHYARALFQQFPAGDDTNQTPAQLVAANPGTGYALIRPPGYGANNGSTWYQPSCGAGPSGIDADDDPES